MNLEEISDLVYGKIDKLDNYLEKGFCINTINLNGWNLLHFACRALNLESVKFLIERTINVNQLNIRNHSPLYIGTFNVATHKLSHDIIDFLLSNGSDPKIGECCIEMAIRLRDFSSLSIFLKYESLLSDKQKKMLKPYLLKIELKAELR